MKICKICNHELIEYPQEENSYNDVVICWIHYFCPVCRKTGQKKWDNLGGEWITGDILETELYTLKCIRCNNVWTPRVPNPVVCPKCKRPYWNTDRKHKK